jgi:hypothetical protein
MKNIAMYVLRVLLSLVFITGLFVFQLVALSFKRLLDVRQTA